MIYDLSIAHLCAVDFLDNGEPSRFVIGIAVRLWYSWWQQKQSQSYNTTSDSIRSYNASIGSYNTAALLHQIIRGHLTQDDKEYDILYYLGSTIIRCQPDTVSPAALKMLRVCVNQTSMEHACTMDTTILDDYIGGWYLHNSHTMIFAKILPPEASILVFFHDILRELQSLDHFLDKVSELDETLQTLLPHTSLLLSTMEAVVEALAPLALELLHFILKKIIFQGSFGLYSHIDSVVSLKHQLSQYPAPLGLFRRAFREFLYLFEQTIVTLQYPVFMVMEAEIRDQRGISEQVASTFHHNYQCLLRTRNQLSSLYYC